jgi:hypothetical protein
MNSGLTNLEDGDCMDFYVDATHHIGVIKLVSFDCYPPDFQSILAVNLKVLKIICVIIII